MVDERIKELRSALGYSQERFADLLSVTRQTVYSWEKGINIPNNLTVKAICGRFGVSYSWLTDGKGEMFVDIGEQIFEDLRAKYNLDDVDMEIIQKYATLSADERKVFKAFLKSFSKEKGGN